VKTSSHGGIRSTDESGTWKLRTAEDTPVGEKELQEALHTAHEQLNSLERDVLALEFVAGQGALEDVCDLAIGYSCPHLEVRMSETP
jgi:hypothetical protein